MACRRSIAVLVRQGIASVSRSYQVRVRAKGEDWLGSDALWRERFRDPTRRSFSFECLRSASTYSSRGSPRSDDSRENSDPRSSSQDGEEQSAPKLWTDEKDSFADSAQDLFLGDASVVDSTAVDTATGEVASGGIWSILRAPADGIVVLVDEFHSLTGVPWWITIIGSTLAFRLAIFPFTITYMKKAAQFATSMHRLPPIRPLKSSNKSLAEQYSIFTKKRVELGIPSPFWATGALVQAPLFIYWVVALRGMANDHHPGFESGGALWFVDLTVPVQGALGALFPCFMALTYLVNIQVSFRNIQPRNDWGGFLLKIYRWWLEAMTLPLFVLGFYVPQGVFMYWLTNNCCNLAQTLALQHDGMRKKFGLPSGLDLEKTRAMYQSRSADLDALVSSIMTHVEAERDDEAMKLLKLLLEKYPHEADAYNVYGLLHLRKQRWLEALENYNLAISKARDDAPLITGLMGSGISMFNQGRKQEAIDAMRPLLDIKVPSDPTTLQKYLRALVTLSSALSQEGFKEEAVSVLEIAVKWDQSIERYIKKLKEDIQNENN